MKDLVAFIATALVDDPASVQVSETVKTLLAKAAKVAE